MSGLWRRFVKLARRRAPGRLAAAQKLARFREIGAANDDFLATLARLQERAERAGPLRLGAAAETHEALSASVGRMVRALCALSGGGFPELAPRLETLDRELSQKVLRARPMKTGSLVVLPGDPDAQRPEAVGPKAARLVGAGEAAAALSAGSRVTLDADAGVVYEGDVPELLRTDAAAPKLPSRRDALRETLRRLLDAVAPLTLTDPESPGFTPEACRTLHDVARFVHQKAMGEMFDMDRLSPAERRACRRLVWPRPMEVRLLDLGEGLSSPRREVMVEDVASLPLQALLEGMLDPRLKWTGPVGFDLKGFVSVVVRSAADDQRYGEPGYAICSADYVHFASRLAYHFAVADAVCGSSVNESYVRFRFHGGAAVAERREWRASFLAAVLLANGFAVRQAGDRVDALLAKRAAAELEDALVMLGRLMVASRHLDMVIESPAAAAALARSFLAGDYGFDQVRRESGPP